MRRPPALSAWADELQSAFPALTRPQVGVLAQYSLGMAPAGRSGLSCVAAALAGWVGQAVGTVRERLRDWYRGAADKGGGGGGGGGGGTPKCKRRELDVDACFGPLLAWVLRDWQGDELPLALDATTLGERFVVLAVAVVYRAGAVPVAWAVLPAAAPGAWRPRRLALLGRLEDVVPAAVGRAVVAADRGLYAKWLFEAIVALGWHPLFRVNAGEATFTPAGRRAGRPARVGRPPRRRPRLRGGRRRLRPRPRPGCRARSRPGGTRGTPTRGWS